MAHRSPHLTRRRLLELAALVGALPACAPGASARRDAGVVTASGDSDAGLGDAGAGDVDAGAGDAGAPADAGLTPTCGEVTDPNIEGPFFTPDSPSRTAIADGLPGRRLILTGVVRFTDCAPAAGAVLDFWQADVDGAYDTAGPTLRGHQAAGADGSYQLTTIIPGRYLNGARFRPAHVHVKVAATGAPLLTTQLYFPEDPYNDGDPFFVASLVVTPTTQSDDELQATFDFVVARSRP